MHMCVCECVCVLTVLTPICRNPDQGRAYFPYPRSPFRILPFSHHLPVLELDINGTKQYVLFCV